MSGWRDRAECRKHDAELWFPLVPGGRDEQLAKRVCAVCPVRVQCLDMAVTTNLLPYGIAGGLNETERAAVRDAHHDRVGNRR